VGKDYDNDGDYKNDAIELLVIYGDGGDDNDDGMEHDNEMILKRH